jgi:LuxR family maltose regulon positive regulatory protein
MLTRSEPPLPLIRWRARGELLEVHSAQLRFSLEETATFLQRVITPTKGAQPLSEEAIHTLHQHLEGWAAGLRLLTLSLQGKTTLQPIEDYLAQSSMASVLSRLHRSFQEYFGSEVFSSLPEDLQFFLLQTSILSRLTGSLCDAVTGRQDSAQLLARIERAGFFLESLDSEDGWYRYHALFAETMKAEAIHRLGKEALHHLSARAISWYEAHAMPVEAIDAALFAEEFERAAYLIEGLDEAICFTESHTVLRWLEQLPTDLLQIHPLLCFRYALARYGVEVYDFSHFRMEPIEALLQMAEEGWRKQGDLPCVGILYAFRTTIALLLDRYPQAVAHARVALQLLSPTSEQANDQDGHIQKQAIIDWRCGCLVALGLEALQEGCFDRAYQCIFDAYTLSLHNVDHTFTRISRRLLSEINLAMGELHQAAEYYQQTLADAGEQGEIGEDIIHTYSVCGLARLSYEWNELERAEQLAREACEYKYSGYFTHWEEETRTTGELLRLLVLHARGEVIPVQQQLSALFARLQASSVPNVRQLIPDVLAWQTRLQIIDGDLAAARRSLNILTSYEKELPPLHLQAVQLLQARLLLARCETAAALRLLGQLLIVALEGKHVIRALEIQLLIALAHAADGQEQKARQWLSEVLSQARKEGFMRLFLDEGEPLAALLRSLLPTLTEKPLRTYARSILHAFADPHASNKNGIASPLLEPLSAQEQRVLTLLVAGHSNPEIAQELVVSVNTIKGHVKNLYHKLNVNNRVQAGEIARLLKLV